LRVGGGARNCEPLSGSHRESNLTTSANQEAGDRRNVKRRLGKSLPGYLKKNGEKGKRVSGESR